MAIATVPPAQSFTVEENFSDFLQDFYNPPKARAFMDQLTIDNTNLDNSVPESDAVDPLPSADQLVVSVAPPTAKPKKFTTQGTQCLLLTDAPGSLRSDGFLRSHGRTWKKVDDKSPAVTGKWNKANMFGPLADRS